MAQPQDVATSSSNARAESGSSAGASGSTATLARGKACLRCRKRKMRCDGAKPACAQCVRAHKPEGCQYDDGRGKTRTQALRERIQRLEEEIAVLRDGGGEVGMGGSGAGGPSIVLTDPHAHHAQDQYGQMNSANADAMAHAYFGMGSLTQEPISSGMSTSSGDSPAGSPSSGGVGSGGVGGGLSAAVSPYSSFDSFNSPQTPFAPLRTLSPAVILPLDDIDLSQSLLDIFLPHRHQLGLALHPERLRASLHVSFPPASISQSHSQGHSRSHSYSHSVGGSPSPGFGGGSSPVPGAQRTQFVNLNVNMSPSGVVASQQSPMLSAQFGQWAPQPRHPALWNSIFLWACFLSRPGPYAQQEGVYLSRTLSALGDALTVGAMGSPGSGTVSPSTATIDAIQASVLLARYYYVTGSVRAAAYHANAATRLAVDAGLHQLGSVRVPVIARARAQAQMHSSTQLPWSLGADHHQHQHPPPDYPLHLDPCADSIELGERLNVWWQAYTLDRILSVSLKKCPCIVDDESAATRVDAPWPEDIAEYETIAMESVRGDNTLRVFFAHQGQQPAGVPGGFSPLALRVKAAALFELAEKVSTNWGLASQSYLPNPTTVETCITRFLSTLMPAHQLSAAHQDDRRSQVVTHTIALTALVQLHARFAREGEMTSLEKCVRAARAATGLMKCLAESDFEFLDPVIGACWASLSSVFSLEQQIRAVTTGTWSPQESSRAQTDLEAIVYALTRLSNRFPISSIQLTRVFELLGTS